MAIEAVIFDVDGTLVDTNQAHVQAWRQAFARLGYDIPEARIAPEIGKGGDKLVPSVLGEDADRKHGDALRKAHGDTFLDIARRTHFRVFPSVEVLLQTLHARGLKTALATSSKMEYLEAVQKSAGIDLVGLVDEAITADEAPSSKPSPDVVVAAVRKLRRKPAQCVMVGDTPFDAEACRRAGVPCLGLRCGGAPTSALEAAGAVAVWEDAADLLAHLDEALARADQAATGRMRHTKKQ